MKTKKPHRLIKILGRNVPVFLLSPADIDKIAEDTEILGYFSGASQTIYINNTLTGIRYEEALYHELMHAILSFSGVNQLLDPKQEEAICTAAETLAYIDE